MGFCSGTDIFDPVVRRILKTSLSDDEKVRLIWELIDALEKHDWDCQDDSTYWDNPLVRKAFQSAHTDWDWLFEDGVS
jgi:hypothetical protein